MSWASVPGPSLEQLAVCLVRGEVTSRALVEDCLERIADPSGEGARAFTRVDAAAARAAADAFDQLRAHGMAPSRFAGIPVSVKDLFDVAGQVTCAGSRVLEDEPAAITDAPAIRRLRQAGLVLNGRTQMPEFALSALDLHAIASDTNRACSSASNAGHKWARPTIWICSRRAGISSKR